MANDEVVAQRVRDCLVESRKIARARTAFVTGFLLLVPAAAQAQRIPIEIAIAAVSPLLVIVLAGVLGLLRRSWRVAGVHAGLIVLWVFLAGLFMHATEYDYVIWTPIVIYAVHSVLIVGLIIVAIGRWMAGMGRSGRS